MTANAQTVSFVILVFVLGSIFGAVFLGDLWRQLAADLRGIFVRRAPSATLSIDARHSPTHTCPHRNCAVNAPHYHRGDPVRYAPRP